MKKYPAIILAAILLATCFTACKKADTIKTADESDHAVITNEDGGLAIDEAGNAMYYVTDENGYIEKDENGEDKTKRIAIDNAIIVGEKIYCKTYSLTIPKGWSDHQSYADLIIKKDGTSDQIKIMLTEGEKLETVMEQKSSIITTAKANYQNAESATKKIDITDKISAQYTYVYVDDTGRRLEQEDGSLKIESLYAGYIFIQHKDDVYSCLITSEDNLNEELDEIVKILGTIDYV